MMMSTISMKILPSSVSLEHSSETGTRKMPNVIKKRSLPEMINKKETQRKGSSKIRNANGNELRRNKNRMQRSGEQRLAKQKE